MSEFEIARLHRKTILDSMVSILEKSISEISKDKHIIFEQFNKIKLLESAIDEQSKEYEIFRYENEHMISEQSDKIKKLEDIICEQSEKIKDFEDIDKKIQLFDKKLIKQIAELTIIFDKKLDF